MQQAAMSNIHYLRPFPSEEIETPVVSVIASLCNIQALMLNISLGIEDAEYRLEQLALAPDVRSRLDNLCALTVVGLQEVERALGSLDTAEHVILRHLDRRTVLA